MKYIVGIDLHGTLLDDNEKIIEKSRENLLKLLKESPENVAIYICTGNDLSFVKRKLGDIFYYFDGAILETGTVLNNDPRNDEEQIITDLDIQKKVKDLKQELESYNFPEVYKFARRLSSISIFPVHGESIYNFYLKIKDLVSDQDLRVTYSSVAVDIVPKLFNKYQGLKVIASKHDQIVGIADSINDREMLLNANYVYLPSNSHPQIIKEVLEKSTKGFYEKAKICRSPMTLAVCEALLDLYSSIEKNTI